ncbi:TPA: hypothetical protein PC598_004316 [Morganella morganii]|uniref:hypothetical protein n=1 Tax=Morganella morganii TaxID=582 RepID=UPI000468EFF0|nr:hypothetical protein [Morganella morganii]HDF2344634.1 hypothetical protein [Morganella morganii]
MSKKEIPIFVPAGIDYTVHNHLACIKFNYHLKPPHELPKDGELFTGLTVEQAVDLAAFLQHYIVSVQSSGSDNQH